MSDDSTAKTAYQALYEQYPDLYDDYPEVAPYIYEKIDHHDEAWVLEHWYAEFLAAGVVVDVPDKTELPFFDPDEHESMSQQERVEIARAYSEYRENLVDASTETE